MSMIELCIHNSVLGCCPICNQHVPWREKEVFVNRQMGWECPRCHRINSPNTPTCFCQPNQKLGEAIWEDDRA